jgi:hypothetical protein
MNAAQPKRDQAAKVAEKVAEEPVPASFSIRIQSFSVQAKRAVRSTDVLSPTTPTVQAKATAKSCWYGLDNDVVALAQVDPQ